MMTERHLQLEELRGVLPEIDDSSVEVNTYKTRAIYSLEVEGITTKWHSVKGPDFDSSQTSNKRQAPTYEVLYNPRLNQWLKLVPPELYLHPRAGYDYENMLRQSVKIQKAALDVAGLEDLETSIREHETINLRGTATYGFVSPHFGPSLEWVFEKFGGKDFSTPLPPDIINLATKAYKIAFRQAVELLFYYHYWTHDPNPGNIIFIERGEKVHVLLIDFAHKEQTSNAFESLARRKDHQRTREIILREKNRLGEIFTKKCGQHNIPFDPTES